MKHYKLDFAEVNACAQNHALAILHRWLPDGHLQAHEYVARNPTRADKNAGSFRINVVTGAWSDFATGDKGKGFISLAQYLFKLEPYPAAERLAGMLGMKGAHHDA